MQKDDLVLRMTALSVPPDEIKSAKIKKIIEEMRSALAQESDGVGLAAPQIGYSLRIFIVSEKVFSIAKEMGEKKIQDGEIRQSHNKGLVFINPEIIKLSKEKRNLEEGCLSVRPFYGKVERRTRAKIRFLDEKGNVVERGASGLMAQIFQHEVDHLNGILFTDRAKNIKEIDVLNEKDGL